MVENLIYSNIDNLTLFRLFMTNSQIDVLIMPKGNENSLTVLFLDTDLLMTDCSGMSVKAFARSLASS